MSEPSPPILLDTNVYSSLFTRELRVRQRVVEKAWSTLIGRPIVIAFQTREELMAGAYADKWGERRLGQLHDQLGRTPTIDAGPMVLESSARLYGWARADGHPLHQAIHRADRWIGACAIAHGLQLASADGIFEGVKDLQLLRPDGASSL